MKGPGAQKQRPNECLWMFWFDEKSISNVCTLADYFWAKYTIIVCILQWILHFTQQFGVTY